MSDETRLSEAELKRAEQLAAAEEWWDDTETAYAQLCLGALVAEVRAFRALFTPERVEALDKLRHDIFRCSDYFVEADWYEQARDVLDRLLANGGAK